MNLFSTKRSQERRVSEREAQKEFHDEQLCTAMSLKSRLSASMLYLDYVDIPRKWPFGHRGLAKAWILPIEGSTGGPSYAVTVDGRGGWTKQIKGQNLLIGSRFLNAPVPLNEVIGDPINATGRTVGELILASVDTGFQPVGDYTAAVPNVDQAPQLAEAYPLSQAA